MRYEEIIDRVRIRGAFASEDDAEAALNATLSALGEQLDDDTAMSIAPQLPGQLRTFLRLEARDVPDPQQDFDPDRLIERVAGLAGTDRAASQASVVTVLGVLGEATGGALDDLRAGLPDAAQPLFAQVPGGPSPA